MIIKSLPNILLITLLSCFWLTVARLPAVAKQTPTVTQEEIPTVGFCEMVTHPANYFDKTVRITAVYEIGYEGSRLNNVHCVRSHDESIGVGFVRIDEKQINEINGAIKAIMSGNAGGQPRVTVVGILRNSSRHAFDWYRYRFEIIRFEDICDDISERIVSHDGSLQAGLTYRAVVKHDSDIGLSFSAPLRIPIHQAVSFEWINLKSYPGLQRLRERYLQQIVFRVNKDNVRQMKPSRWNRTLQLEILLVE
ncbi:MAG TPA: hypothetical protein VGO56_22160 [Pyrinomonadaceae bacterium]|jgi:hypothetical protein|nr:hypothetical protein [Pyrinomonadaceae bacterium]